MLDAVVDTSALIALFTGNEQDRALVNRMLATTAAAPELLDAEVLSVLRRMVRHGDLTRNQARVTLTTIQASPITRIPHANLVDRAWQLQDSITAYDALYVALAELLDVPLITCDAKLAGSNGHQAKVELYSAS
ncbi:type II toxin-antitoxin system ribonuclease VapC1 [Kutzneria viridogrisea]|uniref:Ribonuclease VapC n=1 Tax=Kutzneria viridogrisea TaxID=47990 RepID=A0ABR6BEF0_9PSEU|nr:putative nucleic acid-binding protein [Kutzneria viridogrisea]